MKKTLMVFILLVVVSGCTQTPEQKIAALYTEAISSMESHQIAKAQKAIDEINEINSVSTEGLYLKGLLLEYQLQALDAFEVYTWLMSRTPEYDKTYERMFGILTELEGNLDAAYAANEFTKRTNDELEGELLTAASYSNQEKYAVADGIYATRIKANDENRPFFLLLSSLTQLKLGNVDSSKTLYSTAWQNTTGTPRMYTTAAKIMAERGHLDSAAVLSEKAATAATSTFFDKVAHFRLLLDIGYFGMARGFRHKQFGPLDTLTENKLNLEYAFATGERYLIRDVSDYSRLIAKNNFTSITEDLKARGEIHDNLSLVQDQSMLVGRLMNEEHPILFRDFTKAYSLKLLVRYERNIDSYNKIKEISGFRANDIELTMSSLFLKYQTKGFDSLKPDLERMEQAYATNPYWMRRVGSLYKYGDTRSMEKIYLKVLRQLPYFPEAFKDLVEFYLKDNNPGKAIRLFSNFPLYEQTNPMMSLLKAKAFVYAKEFDSVVTAIEPAMHAAGGSIAEYGEVAEGLYKNNQVAVLNELLTKLNTLCPDNVDVKVLAADYALKQKEYAAAKALIDKAVTVEPDNVDFLSRQVAARFYTGDKDAAIKIFNDLYEIHSTNPYLSLYASKCMADNKTQLEKASNIARGAVFNLYGSVEATTNLCYVYIQSGRYDLAWGEGSKAVMVDSLYAPAHYWKGKAGFLKDKLKHKEDIKTALNKGLQIGLPSDLATDAQAILKELK